MLALTTSIMSIVSFYSAFAIRSRKKSREKGRIVTIREMILFGILCHVFVP